MVPTEAVSKNIQYIINNIILEYGSLVSWKLSELSHEETSWLNARTGLSENENGKRVICLSDIEEDSKKVSPYDHIWGMYCNEFDELDDIDRKSRIV